MAETSTGSQGSADFLEVTVKTLQKGAFPVKVSRDTTVTQLKEKLQPLSEIPAARQRLIFKGRVLRDEQTLQEVGIETGNAVHLVERPADAPPAGPPDPAGTPGPLPGPMPGLNANPANMQDFSRFLGGVLSQLAGGGAAPVPGATPAARGQPPPAQESMHLLVALHTFLQTLEGAAQVPPPIPITSLHPRFQDGATQQYRWLTTALQSVLNPAVLRPEQQTVLQQAVQELEATAPPQQPTAAARPAGDAATGTSAPAAPSGQAPPPTAPPPSAAAGPMPMPGVPFPLDGARGNLRRSPAPPYPYVQLIIPAIVGLVQRTHDYLNGPLARNLEGDISFLRDVRSLEGNRAEVAGRIRELTGRLHAAAALFTELARACAAACLATEGNAAALAFNTAAVLTADGTQPSFPRLLPRSDAPHIADTFIVRGDMDPTQLPAGMPPFPPGMFMMPNMASPGGTPGPTPTPADGSGAQTPAGAGPAGGMPDLGQAGVAGGTARFGPFVTPGGAAFGGFSIQGEGPMDIGQQLMSMFSNIPGAQVVQGPTTTTIAVTSTQFPGEDDLPPPPPPPTGSAAPPNASTESFNPSLDGMPDLSNLPDIPFPDMGAIRIDMADVSLPQLLQQFQGMMGGNFMQQPTPVSGQAQQQPPQATPQSQQQQPQQAGQTQQERSRPMPALSTPWATPHPGYPEAGQLPTHPPHATPAPGPPDVAAILQTLSPVIQNLVQNVVANVVQASAAPAATAATPTATATSSVPGSTTENAPAGLQDQAGIRSAVTDAISTGLEAVLGTLFRNLRSNSNLLVVDGSRGEYIHLMDMVQQLLSAVVADYQPAGATTSSPAASTPAPAPSAVPASSAATTTTTSSTPAAPNQNDGSQPSNSVSASRAATVPGGDSAPSTSAPASSAPSMPPRGLGGTLKATSAKRKAVSAAAKSAAAASKVDGHAAGPGPESADAPTADWSQLLQAAEVMRSTGIPSSVPAASPAVPPTSMPSAALTAPTSQGSPPDSLAAMLGGMGGLGGLASQLTQGGAGGGGGGGLGNLFQMAGRIAADPTMRPMIEQAASELFGGGSSGGGGGLGNLLGSLLGGGGAGAGRPAVQSRSATQSAPSWDALSSLGSPAAEEWRTVIEHDETEQLLMSEQTEFSDAYLAGAPPRGRSLFKKSDAPQN